MLLKLQALVGTTTITMRAGRTQQTMPLTVCLRRKPLAGGGGGRQNRHDRYDKVHPMHAPIPFSFASSSSFPIAFQGRPRRTEERATNHEGKEGQPAVLECPEEQPHDLASFGRRDVVLPPALKNASFKTKLSRLLGCGTGNWRLVDWDSRIASSAAAAAEHTSRRQPAKGTAPQARPPPHLLPDPHTYHGVLAVFEADGMDGEAGDDGKDGKHDDRHYRFRSEVPPVKLHVLFQLLAA